MIGVWLRFLLALPISSADGSPAVQVWQQESSTPRFDAHRHCRHNSWGRPLSSIAGTIDGGTLFPPLQGFRTWLPGIASGRTRAARGSSVDSTKVTWLRKLARSLRTHVRVWPSTLSYGIALAWTIAQHKCESRSSQLMSQSRICGVLSQ